MADNWRQYAALHKSPSHRAQGPSAKDAAVKTCARCEQHLSTAEHFRRDSPGYWRSHCNECAKAITREWRAAHREELLARRRAAYARARNH